MTGMTLGLGAPADEPGTDEATGAMTAGAAGAAQAATTTASAAMRTGAEQRMRGG